MSDRRTCRTSNQRKQSLPFLALVRHAECIEPLIALVSDAPGTKELKELSLAVNTAEGMVLIVGCSHPGIDKIVEAAAAINPNTQNIIQTGHLARTGAQTNLDGRPHDPRQNLEARQSLSARSVRTGGMGCAGQNKELGTLRAQILDRSRQEAVAPQRARDRARQQACPHRLGGAG